MIIYSYPVEKKGKERSTLVWIIKKEKSIGTLGMYFSCFIFFWVWGVTFNLSFDNDIYVIYELWKWYLCVYMYGFYLDRFIWRVGL